jgi:mannosyl-oligosaccharide glucosidase
MLYSSLRTTIDELVEIYGNDKLPPPWQTFTIPNKPGKGNGHLVQKNFEGPFEFDVFYTPASKEAVTSEDLTKALKSASEAFDKKYSSTFQRQAPFTDKKYDGFGKSLFSNLIGGIGYFHGDQMIDRSYAPEYEEDDENFWEAAAEARARGAQTPEGPYELFTSVPSRPFFPRGFLWDEGFHLLPILEWDAEIAMQIISSWYNTMDSDGWIAREQIVGDEARSKVPVEFQVQYPHYANPPTLFMAIEALLNKFDGSAKTKGALSEKFADPEAVRSWLTTLYPLLQRNFDWYRRTQAGDIKTYEREAFSSKEGYRWRGRTPRHTLTSGLDDYPRAQPPHIGELHVDLLSWIGLMARNIQRIASYLGETEDATRYGKIVEAIGRNVDDLHWSKENKAYCDVTADEYDESSHVCHKGYISLFPFMTGLIGPEHQHLKEVLDLIADENELWSPFGIRSLSTRDSGYGQDENYWRSPIWINMNYLIVKELLVSQWICSAHIYGLIRNRISHSSRDLSGSGRRRCIAHFARTWLTMSTIPGSTQALLGSNTTQTPVPDSAHSILRDGLVWWYS